MAITISQPSPANVQTGAAGTLTLTLTSDGRPTGATGPAVLAATGGVAPYRWELLEGRLPFGLALTPDGSISGVPQQRGSALVLVRATDSTSPIAQFTDAYLTVTVQ